MTLAPLPSHFQQRLSKKTSKFTFAKLHGAKNDFIFLPFSECKSAFSTLHELRNFARTVCLRQAHVGADGVLVWDVSEHQDVRVLILNSDGSLAATCGNALRCLGLWLLELGVWDGKKLLPVLRLDVKLLLQNPPASGSEFILSASEHFATQNGGGFATLLQGDKDIQAGHAEVSVEMGEVVSSVKTPVPNEVIGKLISSLKFGDSSSVLSSEKLMVENVFVELANPHWVVLSPHFSLFSKHDVEEFGKNLQDSMRLLGNPQALPVSNIGVLFENQEGWNLVVYERGAGLTECCGSGACAARVALEILGKVSVNEPLVKFKLPGGDVEIGKSGSLEEAPLSSPRQRENQRLILKGPAQLVAQGELYFNCAL